MTEIFNNNGYGYVDLGLPSKTLWATCNVGASNPSDFGLYFQWGDVQGYKAEQVGKDKQFNWDDYKWSIDGSDENFSKYKTPGATLELADDAANANMGGDWHMPTPTQIQELLDNTTTAWTIQNGVNGRLFVSKKDGSKSIFIPAADDAWGGSVYSGGSYGVVWSSVLSSSGVGYGQDLGFVSGGAGLGSSYRISGLSVRGVLDKSLGHKHFEPFQKVLVASRETNTWEPDIYRFYDTKNNIHRCMYYYAGSKETDIIPYEGNEDKLGKQIE